MSRTDFEHDVWQKIEDLDRACGPVGSVVDLHAALGRELRRIGGLLERGPAGAPGEKPDWSDVRLALVALAAQSRRGVRDLRIETQGDAFVRDCPF